MSVSTSRKLHPEAYRDYLRAMFLHYLARNERIDEIEGSLRPLWDRVLEDSYDASAIERLPFLELPGGGSTYMATYKAALMAAVSEELRCRWQGKPSDWICQALHAFVTGGIVPMRLTTVESLRVGDLRVVVSHVASAHVGVQVDQRPLSEPKTIHRLDEKVEGLFITPALSVFNDWDGLQRAAHAELDAMIQELRSRIEADTADWKTVYRKGHQTRVNKTMPLVVDWLVNREQLFYDDRVNAANLLKEIEIDRPRRENRKKDLSE